MMIWTARMPRRKWLFLGLAAAAMIALWILIFAGGKDDAPDQSLTLPDNAARLAYLRDMGWEVEEEPVETLQFLLPGRLSGTYLAYNELQKAQGWDLSACCGKQVTRYTYRVLNYPERPEGVQLNLYICEDRAVAGDVVCVGTDGFQDVLAYPKPAGDAAAA